MSTHNIPYFNIEKKNTLNYPKLAAMGFFPKGFKKEFERTMVNEPTVLEPLKVYCMFSDRRDCVEAYSFIFPKSV